jgi:peptidoglycan/xylan/chitin deacetylase (PgdA/CDA1 family)
MQYLKKHHNIVSLDRIVEHYARGLEVPDNSVVITIDDGYKSNYTLAYPIFKNLDIPATIFLTTDFVDRKTFLWMDRVEYAIHNSGSSRFELKIGDEVLSFSLEDHDSKLLFEERIKLKLKGLSHEYIEEIVEQMENSLGRRLSMDENVPEVFLPLEWHEISEMIEGGLVSVGSHTCSHAILTKCDSEQMKREVLESKRIIKEKTGMDCKFFCYPNGQTGDFSRRTKNLLRETGYVCGLTAVEGMNDRNSDVFEFRRFSANRSNLIDFAICVSGAQNLLSNLRRLMRL